MKSKIAMLLLFVAVSLRLAAQTGSVSGTITNQAHRPVRNAAVTLMAKNKVAGSGLTDTKGVYSIKNVPAGKYDLKVIAINYAEALKRGITIAPNQAAWADVQLKAKNVNIRDEEVKPITEMELPNAIDPGVVGAGVSKPYSSGKNYYKLKADQASGASYSWYAPPPPPEKRNKVQFYDPSEESYKKNTENDFMNVKANPLSTMSVDVDRASYSNVRRFINGGSLPPADAVRVEEMINYFDYSYAQPRGKDPISINTELTVCPWNNENKLLRVGIQAKKINMDNLPPSNLVFLIDVSGSMESPERLPLLVAGMKLLVNNLRAKDKVSIVTYAGNAGLALPPTKGDEKQTILDVLERLQAGGSTAGGAGIKLAYTIAKQNFIDGGNNRVLLATDGDFNVGVSSENELEDLITEERKSGIYLTCLGFGTGNFKDSKMELLADKGNGNYDYIDNIQEAQKTLVSEFGGTLFTIAKDVKAQIEFNPGKVQGYRLVGYEDRLLNEEDFKDDKKDAGDMGSGHVVTILYELIPTGVKSKYMRETNDLKYQKTATTKDTYTDELATIKFRYKKPAEDVSTELVHAIADETVNPMNVSENTRFAAAVAMFGMLLKDSKYKGSVNYNEVIALAELSKTNDKEGYRAEFVRLVKAAKVLDKSTASK